MGEFKIGDENILLNERTDWPTSQGVVEVNICKDTYEKATRFCSKTIKEIYLSNNRPQVQCQQHTSPFSRFQEK